MRIMELVRRHEMTNRPQPVQLLGQALVELDRRMEEEVAVWQAHHCHSGRERKRQPDAAYRQVLEWAIDDADVRRECLVDVNWLVKRATHIRPPICCGMSQLPQFSSGQLRAAKVNTAVRCRKGWSYGRCSRRRLPLRVAP